MKAGWRGCAGRPEQLSRGNPHFQRNEPPRDSQFLFLTSTALAQAGRDDQSRTEQSRAKREPPCFPAPTRASLLFLPRSTPSFCVRPPALALPRAPRPAFHAVPALHTHRRGPRVSQQGPRLASSSPWPSPSGAGPDLLPGTCLARACTNGCGASRPPARRPPRRSRAQPAATPTRRTHAGELGPGH